MSWLFGVKQKPRKETTVTTKLYSQEFDKFEEKPKRSLFSIKRKPEEIKPEQETMQVEKENGESENALV